MKKEMAVIIQIQVMMKLIVNMFSRKEIIKVTQCGKNAIMSLNYPGEYRCKKHNQPPKTIERMLEKNNVEIIEIKNRRNKATIQGINFLCGSDVQPEVIDLTKDRLEIGKNFITINFDDEEDFKKEIQRFLKRRLKNKM